ncbi:flavoprotein [Pseudidiomarina salinarum]|uniref:Flavoprotein n=1 Tax=Pseudidiomarina salinarum TaxID=435908 RepID=A0A094JE41_9GAMM|nr:NAD(P)H-dependent oxidoreductase [Pseudidiomarina salinarum]KFZ30811.1 flavoprotein [Pseudidiomarina salinarum]RUO71279.1 NADPH-dependent oxidoreductase [Pseudidiomarina salinarum]
MNILIFLGSVRQSSPPKPARLGERVALACQRVLRANFPDSTIELIDPLDLEMEPVFKPHFAYASQSAPQHLSELATKIEAADGYVMVSPEYNHSMSPALANLLNHFGASLFSYKPSAIVTYSAGQWGGARAAVGLRTFLGELGCLPVSAMLHLPKAHEVFDTEGNYQDSVSDKERWDSYFNRTFLQLHWWCEATRNQREIQDPHNLISDFKQAPSQRNAPD